MLRRFGEEGVSIVAVIVMMLLVAVMGQVLVSMVGTDNFSTVNQMRTSQAHYIAEAGIERAKYEYANGTVCAALTYNDVLGAGSYAITGIVYNPAATLNVPLAPPVAALTQAFVTWSKTPASTSSDWDTAGPILGELTTPSNLQFRVNAADAAHTIWSQVIEFTNPADILVQKGSTAALNGGAVSTTVTLGTPVDVNKTFVLVGYRTAGSGPDVGYRMLRAQLIDSTTILIDRSLGAASDPITEVVWQAVQLNNAVVQRGSLNFPAVTSPPIVVTLGGQVREVNAGAISISGAQAGLTATQTNTGNAASISTGISTPASNSRVVDVVSADRAGAFTPGGSQIERWDQTSGRATGASSTKSIPAPGPTTMTQTHSSFSNLVHALAAIAANPAAGTITFDGQSSVSQRDVSSISWPHANLGDSNRKLVVGVATDINGNGSGQEDLINVTYNGLPLTFGAEIRLFQGGETQQVEIWSMDEATLPPSTKTQIVPIGAVNTARAVAFAAVQPVGGQNMGRSPYLGDDIIGVGSAAMELATNQLTLRRSNAADRADIGWFVVEFGNGGGGMIDWKEVF